MTFITKQIMLNRKQISKYPRNTANQKGQHEGINKIHEEKQILTWF